MRIVKLAQRNMKAWLRFFDNEAFKDHCDWEGCYCTYLIKALNERHYGFL